MDLRSAHRFSRNSLRRAAARAASGLGLVGARSGRFARPAADCGAPAGTVRVVAVDERLDIVLADGRLVRLGGLDLPRSGTRRPRRAGAARDFLTPRLVGREGGARTAGERDRSMGAGARRTSRSPKPRAARPELRCDRRCCGRLCAGAAGIRGARLRRGAARRRRRGAPGGPRGLERSGLRGDPVVRRRGAAPTRRAVCRHRGARAQGWLWALPPLS